MQLYTIIYFVRRVRYIRRTQSKQISAGIGFNNTVTKKYALAIVNCQRDKLSFLNYVERVNHYIGLAISLCTDDLIKSISICFDSYIMKLLSFRSTISAIRYLGRIVVRISLGLVLSFLCDRVSLMMFNTLNSVLDGSVIRLSLVNNISETGNYSAKHLGSIKSRS